MADVIVDDAVEAYAEAHTTPAPDLFERLAAETREISDWPQMMVGPLQGRFLEFLVRHTKARTVLELGTFTGWSSISMAFGLPEGGRVITCDVNEETTAIARRYAEEAGVAGRIDYRLGPGLDTIASLDGPFDLVFIDADKTNYINYYEAVLPKLADDGVILVDNVLSSGRVAAEPEEDESEYTTAIRDFNEHVMADDRVDCVLLTIRDGVTMIHKR
jgi:caffeoyl-CoA O-methyltransferase